MRKFCRVRCVAAESLVKTGQELSIRLLTESYLLVSYLHHVSRSAFRVSSQGKCEARDEAPHSAAGIAQATPTIDVSKRLPFNRHPRPQAAVVWIAVFRATGSRSELDGSMRTSLADPPADTYLACRRRDRVPNSHSLPSAESKKRHHRPTFSKCASISDIIV